MKFMESTLDHSELGVGIQQKLDGVYHNDTMFNNDNTDMSVMQN